MCLVDPLKIMCFECVQSVVQLELDGSQHVRCLTCNHTESLEKALDDCFVFIVASAVSENLKKTMTRNYRFMPFAGDRIQTVATRSFMVRTGRALLAVAA